MVVREHGQSLVGERDFAEFKAFELPQSCDHLQFDIGQHCRIGQREASQRGDVFDQRDACRRFEAFAKLQILQRQFRKMGQKIAVIRVEVGFMNSCLWW